VVEPYSGPVVDVPTDPEGRPLVEAPVRPVEGFAVEVVDVSVERVSPPKWVDVDEPLPNGNDRSVDVVPIAAIPAEGSEELQASVHMQTVVVKIDPRIVFYLLIFRSGREDTPAPVPVVAPFSGVCGKALLVLGSPDTAEYSVKSLVGPLP
jgi:hypothetical protein